MGIQILERNMGEFLFNLSVKKGFKAVTETSEAIQEKMINLTTKIIFKFFLEKVPYTRSKGAVKLGEKVCRLCHKGLITL